MRSKISDIMELRLYGPDDTPQFRETTWVAHSIHGYQEAITNEEAELVNEYHNLLCTVNDIEDERRGY